MRIGFLGTGTISSAIVFGLCKSEIVISSIIVSPRNERLANTLANQFSVVTVARDNQQVVDNSDIIFVGLRAEVAEKVLSELSFHDGQKIVTLVPTTTRAKTAEYIKHKGQVFRAVPLPFIAMHKGATPIFPGDDTLAELFSHMGGVIIADNEDQFNLFMTAGSVMGVYFHFMGTINIWLQDHGLTKEQSSVYLSGLFKSLAEQMNSDSLVDFKMLEDEYSTKGGTNELITKSYIDSGGDKAMQCALDKAFKKMQQ